jgi:hypothetical protein
MINNVFIDNSVIRDLVMSPNTKKVKEVQPVPKSNDSDVLTFSEYITKYTNDNKCKLINPVSHIKLDGDDVVIYQKGCYDKYTSGYGDITINREIARIPKCEIIALLQELKNQTVED